MTKIHLEPVSWMEFGAGMAANIECHKENEVDASWSTWVDMSRPVLWIVSSMENWAELDGPGLGPCYSIIEEQMGDVIRDIETQYARYVTDWNTPNDKDPGVVRLWQFTVDDGSRFRNAVTEITSTLKEAEHEHQGDWYEMLGEGEDDINYFVVGEFENFAEMDQGRTTAASALAEAVGEEAASALWAEMFGALADDVQGYNRVMLRRIPDWSYDANAE
ncbi:MAG: hypothetical protein V2J20_06910 [Wenzhouxiangella sp.]|nr:hypothetical protein [Wenzhouxiangella sp.]